MLRKKGPGGGGGGGGGAGGGGGGGGGGKDDEEIPKAKATVSADLRVAIQQARLAKKNPDGSAFTQKQLAQAIQEQPAVIQAYESGNAVPNGQLLSKLERALGVKLPRPPKK